jgi:hypothetical protein
MISRRGLGRPGYRALTGAVLRDTAAGSVWLIALLLVGCATTPEGRLRNALVTEIYWDAAQECQVHFPSLHRDRIALNGNLELDVDAGQTQDIPDFAKCYWEAIAVRVEKRRAAGLPMPEPFELKPEVTAATEVGR